MVADTLKLVRVLSRKTKKTKDEAILYKVMVKYLQSVFHTAMEGEVDHESSEDDTNFTFSSN